MKTKFTDNLIITLVVLGMLLLATGIIFMSTKDSAYAVDLNNQNNQTNNANVTFDAGFENSSGVLEHSIVTDINPEYKYLHIKIGLAQGCTLINPRVQFYDSSNGADINFNLGKGFGNMTGQYIKTTDANNKTIQFENLSQGLDYSFGMNVNLGNNVNIAKLNDTTKVVFNATLSDSSGNTYNISKDIYFNVGWTANLSMNISQTVENFYHTKVGSEDNLVIETEVIAKLDTSGKYNILPVKQTQLVIEIPTYQGILPTRVNVTAKRTGATNGKKDADVVFSSDDWTYNLNTKKLTITVENTVTNGIATASRDYDQYIITYTYPQEAYDAVNTNGVNISNIVAGTMTLYSNTSTTAITKNLNDTIKLTDYVERNSNGTLHKAVMQYNTLKKYTSDMAYAYTLTHKNRQKVENSKSKEVFEQVKFKAKDGTEYNSFIDGTNYVPISKFQISVRSFNNYFGASGAGSIEIYEDDRTYLGTITRTTATETINGEAYYTFSIPTETKTRAEKISIIKTAPANELAEIEIGVVREISKNLPYTIKQIQTFKQTTETIKGYHTSVTDNTVFEYEAENDVYLINDLIDTYTNANFKVTTPTLKAELGNQKLEFDIELDNAHFDSDVWNEPCFDIVLPEYIESIGDKVNNSCNISSSDTVYMGNYVYARKINNRYHIIIPFWGTHKAVFNNQTTIHIALNVTVNPYATNSSKEIELYYINKLVNSYKNPSTWPATPESVGESITSATFPEGTQCGIATSEVNFSAEQNLLCVSEISQYNGTDTIDSLRNANTTAQIERDSNAVPKMTLILQNNHTVPVSNISVLGRIPFTNNKYAISNLDLGTSIDTTLASNLSSLSGKNVTIYYSDNIDATKDISLATNNWKTEVNDLSTIKSYLIVVNDTLEAGEQIRFSYTFNLPANIKYKRALYANFGSYYTVDGTDRTSETEKIGLATETGPILEIDKTSRIEGGEVRAREGDIITYTITVRNRGSVDAKEVEINDIIPENTTYVTLNDNGEYVEDSSKKSIQYNIETLGAGQRQSFSFSVIVGEITENKTIQNIADVIAEGVDKVTSNPTSTTALPSNPNLVLTKTSNIEEGMTVDEGDLITYTITVRNTGDGIAKNVIIKDTIPENTIYYDEETKTTDETKTEVISEPMKVLKAGESYTFAFTVIVDKINASITIQNTATVTADNSNDVNSNTLNITAKHKAPNLIVRKTNSIVEGNIVKEGDLITYTITVENTGDGVAKNVIIRDTIPENTVYYNTETNSTNSEISVINSEIKETLNPKETFSHTFTVQVGRISSNKTISNVAKATGEGLEEISSNTSDVNAVITTPRLKFTKTSDIAAGTSVKAGSIIRYTLTVENIGTTPAYNVTLKDTVPSNTTYCENDTKDNAKKNVEKNIEKLNPGMSESYSFTVMVNEITENVIIENTAKVLAENSQENSSNTVSINATPKEPNLEITKTSSVQEGTAVKEGDIITYTVTVRNIGEGIAKGVIITDTIPEGTNYYDEKTGTINTNITTINSETKETLNPGEIFTYKLKVQVGRINTNKIIQNTAKVKSSNFGELASNTVNTDAVITKPNLKVTKTSSIKEGNNVKEGDLITYTIKVENIGTTPAYDVVIRDTIPENTTYYENNVKNNEKKSVSKNIEKINPGMSESYSFTVMVNEIEQNKVIENTARVIAENGEEQTSNTLNVNAVVSIANLKITKESNIPEGAVVKEGNIITYTIKVENIGTTPAYNVEIKDQIPEHTTYYENNTKNSEIKNVGKNIERLEAGQSETYTFMVIVNEIMENTTIENTARVIAENGEEQTSNTVNINAHIKAPDLKVTKESDVPEGTTVKEGDIITYKITVKNIGDEIAKNIKIIDNIPEDTVYYNEETNSVEEIEKINSEVKETLGINEEFTFSFKVKVKEITENRVIRNTAQVMEEKLSTVESNTVEINAKPKQAILEVKKTSNIQEGGTVQEGDIITYKITVKNIGETVAKNVIIKDKIPDGTIYYDEIKQENPNMLLVNSEVKEKLEPGESFEYGFKVQVGEVQEGTIIKNIATAIGENTEETSSNTVNIKANANNNPGDNPGNNPNDNPSDNPNNNSGNKPNNKPSGNQNNTSKDGNLPYTGTYSLVILLSVAIISLSIFTIYEYKRIKK